MLVETYIKQWSGVRFIHNQIILSVVQVQSYKYNRLYSQENTHIDVYIHFHFTYQFITTICGGYQVTYKSIHGAGKITGFDIMQSSSSIINHK